MLAWPIQIDVVRSAIFTALHNDAVANGGGTLQKTTAITLPEKTHDYDTDRDHHQDLGTDTTPTTTAAAPTMGGVMSNNNAVLTLITRQDTAAAATLHDQSRSAIHDAGTAVNNLLTLPATLAATGALVGCPRAPRETDKPFLYNFFHALAYIYPCATCRLSYQQYIASDPPEESSNMLTWLWELKNKVNHKLNRTGLHNGLPLEKYERRLRVLSSFSSPDQVWDLVTIFALYYPDTLPNDAEHTATHGKDAHASDDATSSQTGDKQQQQQDSTQPVNYDSVYQRRRAYLYMLAGLHLFLGRLPTHRTMAAFLNPLLFGNQHLSSRDSFLRRLVYLRQQWATQTQGFALGLEETIQRYSLQPSLVSTPVSLSEPITTAYTCPNPALLPSGKCHPSE